MQSVKFVSSVTDELRKLFLSKEPSTVFPTRLQHSYTPIESSPTLPNPEITQTPSVENGLNVHSIAESSRYLK